MFFLQAFIMTVVSLIPYAIIWNKYRKFTIAAVATQGILLLIINYLLVYSCICTAYPLFGGLGFLTFVEMLIAGVAVMAAFSEDIDSHIASTLLPGIVGILIFTFSFMSGCNMLNATKYACLVGSLESKGTQQWAKDNQPIDQNNIRLVPESLALANAKLVLNNGSAIGSSYELNSNCITLQRIVDKYFYLIPLDYRSFGVWSSVGYVDGYVKVSATDPYAKAELITGKKMRYTPEAFFDEDLKRHLYTHGYSDYIMDDVTFESDDAGNTYWTVTMLKPTVAFSGDKVVGVALVDPESGTIKFEPIDKIDSWIDRVVPSNIAQDNLEYWGALKDGWWNSFWTHRNLSKPESPVLNYTSDGRCMFVTPITSVSNNDQTMLGIVYTDARTGVSTYYQVTGGATEEAIVAAVNSSEVSYKGWHASSQLVYENILGNLCALAPVMGTGGNYQGLAIVETQNKRVAFGKTPAEALREFDRILSMNPSNIESDSKSVEVHLSSTISRIGWDTTQTGKQYNFILNNSSHIFTGTSTIISLSKEGDYVSITYMSNSKGLTPVTDFKNVTLGK